MTQEGRDRLSTCAQARSIYPKIACTVHLFLKRMYVCVGGVWGCGSFSAPLSPPSSLFGMSVMGTMISESRTAEERCVCTQSGSRRHCRRSAMEEGDGEEVKG